MGRSQRVSCHLRHSIQAQQYHPNPSIVPISLLYQSLSQKTANLQSPRMLYFSHHCPPSIWAMYTVYKQVGILSLSVRSPYLIAIYLHTDCDHSHKVMMPATVQTTRSFPRPLRWRTTWRSTTTRSMLIVDITAAEQHTVPLR